MSDAVEYIRRRVPYNRAIFNDGELMFRRESEEEVFVSVDVADESSCLAASFINEP